MISTAAPILATSRTPLGVYITLHRETDYTDTQFYADLKKARKSLDRMKRKALKEHAQGKTRKFPED